MVFLFWRMIRIYEMPALVAPPRRFAARRRVSRWVLYVLILILLKPLIFCEKMIVIIFVKICIFLIFAYFKNIFWLAASISSPLKTFYRLFHGDLEMFLKIYQKFAYFVEIFDISEICIFSKYFLNSCIVFSTIENPLEAVAVWFWCIFEDFGQKFAYLWKFA